MKVTPPLTRPASATAVLVCAIVFTPLSHAQSNLSIALTGGVATDQRGVQSNALTIAPDLRVDADRVTVQLGASASRFESEVWSLGGSGALARRDPLGRHLALTLNASGGVTRLGGAFQGTYTELAAVPALEVNVGALTLFGGVRAAHGSSSVETQSAGPGFPFPGSGATRTSSSRSGTGPLFGLVASFSDANAAMRLGAREDRMRVDGGSIADRSASLSASGEKATITLIGGARSAADERDQFGSAALSLRVLPNASIEIAGGRFPRNRLLETPGGKFFNAGLSFRVGGSTAEQPLPAPSGARAVPAGVTRLSIRAPNATRVEIAGDFNDWKPARATRADNGVWYADLRIPPGQYRYAFRVDGNSWRVPDGATAVDDGFGGKSAWLTVRDRPK